MEQMESLQRANQQHRLAERHPRKRTTIKPILRIRDEGSAEIRRPFFLRTSEKGAKSRLTVLTPAI